MRQHALKLDNIFRSAQAARSKTVAVGYMAWQWLRVRTRKTARIRAAFRQAFIRKQEVLARAVAAFTHPTDVAKSAGRLALEQAMAKAQAEMMARVHAEQKAILGNSQLFGALAENSTQANARLSNPDHRIGIYPAWVITHEADGPKESESLPDTRPEATVLSGLSAARSLGASRAWRPDGVRSLRRGGLSYVRRALASDPQSFVDGEGSVAGAGVCREARAFHAVHRQKRCRDHSRRSTN